MLSFSMRNSAYKTVFDSAFSEFLFDGALDPRALDFIGQGKPIVTVPEFEDGQFVVKFYEAVPKSDSSIEGELSLGEQIGSAVVSSSSPDGELDQLVVTRKDGDTEVTTTIDAGNQETEVRIAGHLITGSQIGSILGSTLGRQIAGDNQFAQLAVGTLISTLGLNLGQLVDQAFDIPLGEFADGTAKEGFSDFGLDLTVAAAGAIGSYLVGELVSELGLDGVGGELLNSAGSAVVGQIAENLITGAGPFVDVGGALTGAVGSFVGRTLANEVVSFDTIGGQIGASLGGSAGAVVGAKLIGQLLGPAFGGPVGALIGSFVGTLLGGLIGSLFGGTPRSAADVVWNEATGEFEVANVWSRKGGSKQAARDLATSAAEGLNGVLGVIGGDLIDGAAVQAGTYGMRKKDFTYRPESTRDNHAITERTRDAGELINHGLFQAFDDSDFRIAGGDIYLKRAFYNSIANTSSPSDFQLEMLLGDLAVARDYRGYLQNSTAINALISADPDSAFAAGWTVTLVRAIELGLHKRHEADWYGGWERFLEDADLTAANLVMGLSGKARVMTVVDQTGAVIGQFGDTIDSASKDVIEGTSGADTIDLTHQPGIGNSGVDVIADTRGLTVNGRLVDDVATPVDDYTHVADTLTFTPGQTSKQVAVTLTPDALAEGVERFLLELANASGATLARGQATAVIVDDGTPHLTVSNTAVRESEGHAVFTVALTANAGADVTVDLRLESASALGGGVDFGDASNTMEVSTDGGTTWVAATSHTFAGGVAGSVLVRTAIVNDGPANFSDADDTNDERTERFHLVAATGSAAVANATATGVGIILQDSATIVQGDVPVTITPEPVLLVDDIVVDEATGMATFTVRLSHASGQTVTVDYHTADLRAFTIDVGASVYGGGGADVITGGDLGNELFGESGDDVLTGGGKADWLFGGDGNDTLYADRAGGVSDGNYLDGGAGDDVLEGRGGSDWLEGGAGIDTLRGGAGDDVLAGGAGVDDVRGGSGNDQYILRRGDGADTLFDEGLDYTDPGTPQLGDLAQLIADRTSGLAVRNWSGGGAYVERGRAAGGADVLVLGPGIGLEDLLFVRGGTVADPGTTAQDLVLKIIDGAPSNLTGEQVVMKNWFDPFHRIETLRLADGQEVGIGHFSSFIIGTDAAEVIVGTAGGDFIHAAGGDDQVFALFGNDLANGGAGNDVVDGGGDADVVLGADGDDMVSGGLGIDTVSGGRGSDRLLGGAGNDILAGESGADWIAGGSGDDIIRYRRGDGHDVVLDDFAANTWEIAWISGPGFQSGNGYSLVAQPFDVDGDGVVEAGETRDTLEYNGRVIFDGARWLEWVYYDFDGSGGNPGGIPDGPSGTLYHLIDSTVPLTADAGVDTLEFAIGIDVNDIHMEWRGTDLVLGIARPGEDVARFADITDTVTLKEWGGAGAGAIERFAFFNTGLIDTTGITQWGGGSDGDDTVTGSLNRDWLTGNGGDDVVSGQGGDDILAGNAGFDVLDGGAGADVLLGGTGNDMLIGGIGADVLVGGGGFDAASYEDATTGVTASLSAPTTNTDEAAGDSYDGIENLIGSDHADTLEGDGGANELTGGLGADTLRGLGGDDTYLYDLGDGADTIEDTAGEDTILFGAGIALSDLSFAMSGADLVITVAAGDTLTVKGFTTAANKVETLQFVDGLSVNLAGLVLGTTGTTGDDLVVGGGSLSGGVGADTLLGGSGADTLTGGLGDDQLDGGAGADALAGGDGVDTAVYTGSAAGVVVDLGDGLAESGGDASGDTLVGIEHVLGSAHADTLTGDAGDNVLKGNAGNDTISGVAGANVLIGDDGDDTINGGTGEDNIDGGAGIDTIHGLDAADIVNGGDGGDLLYGGLGDDTVIGGAGDDTMEGNDGADILAGGDGADTLSGGAGNDRLDGGAGDDSLTGGAGDDTYSFTASSGQDTVMAGGGLDEVVFDASVAPDQLTFEKVGGGLADLKVTVAGGAASITIAGWFTDDANKVRRVSTASGMLSRFDLDRLFDAGATSLAFADLAGLWQDAALYEDRAIVTGTAGNDTLTIDPNYVGGQTLVGLGGNDTLTGGEHDDVLIGGDGVDTMDGGAGDDTFLNASDASRDHITGGAGYDRIVATVAGAQIRLNSVTGVEEISAGGHEGVDIKNGIPHATFDFTDVLLDGIDWILLGGGNDTLVGSAADDRVTGDNGNDVVHGGLGDDTLFLGNGTDTGYGNAGDDYLSGGRDADSLFGGDGDDVLHGGDGFDTLDGGAGIDTADFSGQAVGTTIYLHDAVFGSGHAYDQQELITNIENVIGTDGADTIWGDDQANRLDGGLGDDTLHGGLGDDTFVLEDGADSLDGGDGIDTVDYSAATTSLTVDLSLGTATVGGVTDTLTNVEAVIGGSGDDSFMGGAANDLFTGGAGNDTIDGGGGTDVAVFAGLRADYVIDTAIGTVTHTPTGEVDTFTRIETLRFADTDVSLGINPNNRPDVLSPIPSQSLRETDTLSFQIPGSAFGDQDSDPLSYVASQAGGAPLPAWLTFNEQTGLFSGTPAVGDQAVLTIEVKAFDGQAYSDPSAFTIEVLVKGAVIAGTPTAETLTGGAGHDEISGLGGDDTLVGLVGRDELDGGAGSDTADYAASPEAVSVDLATGAASGGHAAGDSYVSIENLTGSEFADTLRGDGAANVLRGLGAADQLYGAGGDDRLEGGAGDDSLFGDDGADTLVGGTGTNSVTGGLGDDTIVGGAGADTVDGGGGSDTMDYAASVAGITVDLSAGTAAGGDAANDSLTGIENITGTALADGLTGDGAANRLDGGGGDDTLSGGAGADVLIGGTGTDTVTYAAAGAGVTATLGGTGSQGEAAGDQISGVERLIGSGFADTLTGDGAANTLHGGAGNDTLHGLGGVDHLYGEDGDDHLYGGAGGDFLYGGAGNDHIEAGAEGDHLDGGAGNDRLMGSTGNDTYHVGRTSGHDVIDNYDQSGSLDRVVYATDVAYDSLWFERGDYNATTGVFTRNDTGGTELRVTVLGTTAASTSSVVVLDMFDATTGAMLDQYKVDLFQAGRRKAYDNINVPQLLTIMQLHGDRPTGVDSVPSSILADVDAAWGFNTAPQISLTTTGIDPANLHVAEDGTLTLTFDVADLDAQGQVETPADALVVIARTSGSLFPAEIASTQVDANTRQIVLDPNQFAGGTETITVEVSDGTITTPLDLTVTVDPVAATPSLTIADPILATNAGTAIALGISASLGGGAGDPSETLEVDITGWPAGATFSAGSVQGGVWRVTAAQLAGLTMTPPAGAGTDITLSVRARARETTGGSMAESAAQTIAIAVNGTPTDVRVKHQTSGADITTSLGIPEITPGAIVGNLQAADPDAGGSFTYAVVHGPDAANFEVVGNQLKLKDTVSLDFETAADRLQEITVRATDQGGLSFDRALTITVTDIDEKPSQPSALGPVDFVENEPILAVTLTGATDPEETDVDYSFRLVGGVSGNTAGLFTITNDGTNSATLALNNDTPLDFEFLEGLVPSGDFVLETATRGYLEVKYVATDVNVTDPNVDFDDARKSATQTVRIYVDDINEAPGTPTATWQRTTPVNENTAAHIATLTAADPDGDPLTYKVTGNNASYFEIKNGNQLWTRTAIDYEALGSSLRVDVKADDGPLDSATPWSKTITIANTNDNNPEFTNGTDNASGVDHYPATSVNENTPVNSWLDPKFLATDPDGGSLSYSIIGGNTGNAFTIAPYQDGARLKIANGVDYETQTTYNLTLEVKDAGGRKDTAAITVNVQNVTEWQLIADFDNLPQAFGAPAQNINETIEIIGNGANGIPHGYRYYSNHTFAYPYVPNVFTKRISNTSGEIDYITLVGGGPAYPWVVAYQHPAIRYDETTNEVFWNLDYVAPVVLDLDSDGIELVPVATSKTTFDANSDGNKDITGWVSAEDALLVLDRDGDGVIGDGSEISFVQDLPGATTDMEGLVAYDTNADGVFDGADERFGEFQIWQDANQNGVSEAEELKSLAEAGIAGIDLALTPTGQTVEGATDNVIVNTAEFIRADGTTGLIGDAAFAYVPGTPEQTAARLASQAGQRHDGLDLDVLDWLERGERHGFGMPYHLGNDGRGGPGTAIAATAPAADEAVVRLVQAMAAFDAAPSAAFDRRDREVRPRPLTLTVNDHM